MSTRKDSNIHGMAYNAGGGGNIGRAHRGQQAARQQHVSTPQYKSGSHANQRKGSGSPSAKRQREDSRPPWPGRDPMRALPSPSPSAWGDSRSGHQPWQPEPSPPPTRLLPLRQPLSQHLVNRQNENEPNERVWDQMQDQIRDLQQKLLKSEQDYRALRDSSEAERNRHAQDVESYERKLREMEAKMQSANKAQTDKRTLQEMERQNAELQRRLQQSQQDNMNLRNSYERQIADLQRELQQSKQDNKSLRNSYERQIADLQEDLRKSQQDYKTLRNSHEVLQGEHKIVISKNQDLLQRISSMASERMRSNNPCVEDLSDQYRHSAVLSSWQALMNGEYWTLYETALKQLPNEQHTAHFLLSIMELGFKEAQYLQNGSKAFMDLMQSQRQAQSKADPAMAALLDSLLKNENFREIVDSESKKVRKGGKATLPANASQDFHAKICKEWRNLRKDLLERSHKFADEVLRLCFLMALQSPPMALVFDRPEGRQMDALLYEPDGDRNKPRPWTVKFVLTPPLLRHEGGAVLCKGSVELR